MRTTGRNKKQVNYANNGAGKTGGVNTQLAEEEKKIAKQKEKQRQQNQRQAQVATTPVATEMPRAVVKWIECTICGKWRKVGLGIDVDLLPDNWRCNMNNWDLARANCSVPEETDDKSKNESGGSGLQYKH